MSIFTKVAAVGATTTLKAAGIATVAAKSFAAQVKQDMVDLERGKAERLAKQLAQVADVQPPTTKE